MDDVFIQITHIQIINFYYLLANIFSNAYIKATKKLEHASRKDRMATQTLPRKGKEHFYQFIEAVTVGIYNIPDNIKDITI